MNNVKKILEEALKELERKMTFDAVTVLLQDAVEKIMEITGESASEAVVNKIFFYYILKLIFTLDLLIFQR